MKIYYCGECTNQVHFENAGCLNCGASLGFEPDSFKLLSFREKAPDGYTVCANAGQSGCNWLVANEDGVPYCFSCRLTAMLPDLDVAGNLERWSLLEAAKRYFLYGVMRLGLPVISREQDPEHGLSFELLADQKGVPDGAVLTGHDNGLITINIAEASNSEREARRDDFDEPLRTLVGHFRHESGHYYWDLLVDRGGEAEAAREVFGDERQDYSDALKVYYESGPSDHWQQTHISAYATSHPWEDFAETWAHYLHITDSFETATEYGLLKKVKNARAKPDAVFDQMIQEWVPLTVAVNALNRGMGQQDLYPFVLSQPVIDKLRFIDKLVRKQPTSK